MTTDTIPVQKWWMWFTGDHDEADAIQRFVQRYGQAPQQIVRRAGRYPLLLVGPVPDREGDA